MDTTSENTSTENKPVAVAPDAGRPVIVCTDKRGVFFGYVDGDTVGKDPIVLRRARMCVYWSEATRGALGLASTGPGKGSRISPAGPSIELRGITCVMECSPEAVAVWEQGPWKA